MDQFLKLLENQPVPDIHVLSGMENYESLMCSGLIYLTFTQAHNTSYPQQVTCIFGLTQLCESISSFRLIQYTQLTENTFPQSLSPQAFHAASNPINDTVSMVCVLLRMPIVFNTNIYRVTETELH